MKRITFFLVIFYMLTGLNNGAISAVLTHGPVVGGVDSTSARVFVRTDSSAKVTIKYGTEPQNLLKTSNEVVTGSPKDYAGIVDITGLSPNTVYYYNILVDSLPQLKPPYPQFKTFPNNGDKVVFKFAVLTDFGGLQKGPPYFYTFTSTSKEFPDFVIIGGDFDHRDVDTLTGKREMFKELYTPLGNMSDFVMNILRRSAVAHHWDDHDYGDNNGDKTYPYKERSLRVLKEFFPVYPVSDYGDWQRFTYGHTDLFMLDSRSQRDPESDLDEPDKSMLDGDNLGTVGQLNWLLNGLKGSTARWKFILTPVPFNPTCKPKDSWGAYLYEREALVNFIKQNNITGVIFISGDLHAGGIDDGSNSDFPEMVVPCANCRSCQTAWSDKGVWSVGYYGYPVTDCPGYSLVTVMTNPDKVLLEVKDEYGNTLISYIAN